MALVEPPMAWSVRIAFSKASIVSSLEGRRSRSIISTICDPAASASWARRESTAGIAALPGRAMPSASPMAAIVDAVPITMQWPGLRMMLP